MQAQHIAFLQLLNGQVQYVVPRWQRRYCWGQDDIERLVDDLLTVAVAAPDATHYGGTLLTFPEPVPAGVVTTIRVVDGQQRLTTVSIILACIAAKLGPEGQCGDWTAEIIHDFRLTNPRMPLDKCRKLRLQDGDEEEYRLILEGDPAGDGAVTQAWEIARRLVDKHGAEPLLLGLERLRVVSIGLTPHDDPQQIFESLNATGRPLTESEKVKNWLLMKLRDDEQQDLYDNHWHKIEQRLGGQEKTGQIDTFLRDVLRWRTGETRGMRQVYFGFRRWAVRQGQAGEGPAICRELARLAKFYGMLIVSAGSHSDKDVERQLRHLRELGIDVHRPLTLRLLHDAAEAGPTSVTNGDLAEALAGIAAWTTRLWLADRSTAGMNRAVAELAHGAGPSEGDDFAEYWIERISRLRNTRVGVPDDDAVREGIRTRKAYGGSATRSTNAILCALMEAEELDGEAAPRAKLTVEHVMPQKLTEDWENALGDGAEEIHGRYLHRLANLTLTGVNSVLGADPFEKKREVYGKSAIQMTRCLAGEDKWDVDALDRRADDLTRRALELWPWQVEGTVTSLSWRIDSGQWHAERAASQMVLNVTGALLSLAPENAEKLSGEATSTNVHPVSRYPAGTKAGALTMHAIPGHDKYVMWPYGSNDSCIRRCVRMGERCGIDVEVKS